jgi:alkylresorcinol/alkylpyrone synthase
MRIVATGRALPPHRYDQRTLRGYLARVWSGNPEVMRRLDGLWRNIGVEERSLALPLEEYAALDTFGAANDAWIARGLVLGEEAIRNALAASGLEPRDVDAVFFSTVTGLASPSLDARLANALGLRTDVKRVPMFGLGCVAGAAAVARAADYVAAYPRQVAVVLTVELCSLTFQRDDLSTANLISAGLFGDGASAAVVAGTARGAGRGLEVLATRSVFYPDTEDVMGWSISERGFRIVLSAAVPAVARERLRGDVDAFLTDHGLHRSDVRAWICHPGGPKVLRALEEALELEDHHLAASWRHLASCGNLSSASVLMILGDTVRARPLEPGEYAVMLAMGPGFCSELLLLRQGD